jgi:RNA polymerase sigma factor (sigma-70 family)
VEPDTENVQFDSERRALYRALGRLSHHQRAALLLREWEGRSFGQIAELLGCAESTARVHHTRARETNARRAARRGLPDGAADWEGQET